IALSGGPFHLKPYVALAAITISGSWEYLLMEAARQRDEAQESESQLPPWAAPADAATEPTAPKPSSEVAAEPEIIPVMAKRVRPAKPPPAPVDNFRPTIDEMLICS